MALQRHNNVFNSSLADWLKLDLNFVHDLRFAANPDGILHESAVDI
jgi:hypothetical protein